MQQEGVRFNSVLRSLHSLPEHELQEESRDLEEEQEAAGTSERYDHNFTAFWSYLTRAGFLSTFMKIVYGTYEHIDYSLK